MLQEEKMEKRKKDKEEIQKRFADVEAKEAGPKAIRKGKYPRCTQ